MPQGDSILRSWLWDKALPWCVASLADRKLGGFNERFDWSGKPVDPGFKRIRVAGRQVYVMAHAALGGVAGAREVALEGVNYLVRYGLRPDGQFVSRLNSDGSVLESSTDLYDVAFGLFAMAWWYRLTNDPYPLEIASTAISLLRTELFSPSGKGYRARARASVLHEQNPHMHLFEAAIFLTGFSGRVEFRQLADELFDLAANCLFDSVTDTLPEFFDTEWRAGDERGRISVEPGHHYEWVWLLNRYGELSGTTEAFQIAERLFTFAQRHGHDPDTGLIFDAVGVHGEIQQRDFRIWPNTEFLKAQIAMQERHGKIDGFDDEAIEANITRILKHFLSPQTNGPAKALGDGLWIDYLEGQSLTPKCDHVPASTLYHIMFGFTEYLRFQSGHTAFSGLPW